MVNDNNQEAEFNNASYKNNKKRKLKSWRKEEKFFIFLAYFKKKEGIIFVFL